MEFMNRGGQQQPVAPTQATQHHVPTHSGKKKLGGSRAMRIISVVLLVSAALLVGTLAMYLGTGGGKTEGEYIDKSKYQAVFLNGGQVYFGKIDSMNSKFLTVSKIYYLRVNQQVQPNQSQEAQQNVSLAKLGCELHGPQDKMVINREQVTFWENLKDDGQVVKAITKFVNDNPQGQKCEAPAESGANSNSTAAPAANSTPPANNTPNTPATTAPNTPATNNRRP